MAIEVDGAVGVGGYLLSSCAFPSLRTPAMGHLAGVAIEAALDQKYSSVWDAIGKSQDGEESVVRDPSCKDGTPKGCVLHVKVDQK